jgi:hypothetical protein
VSIPELIQDWKFFKEERADSTPLKDMKPVEPEFELERPGILKLPKSSNTITRVICQNNHCIGKQHSCKY